MEGMGVMLNYKDINLMDFHVTLSAWPGDRLHLDSKNRNPSIGMRLTQKSKVG
jgi:hypothetical protein